MAEPIDLEDINVHVSEDEFWAIRGKAVQAYANLEQGLCRLFARCAGLYQDAAGVIFFKITTPRVIYEIISKLLRKRFGDDYNVFWNSMQKFLMEVSQKRNEIVHWNTLVHIEHLGGKAVFQIKLSPPNLADFGPNTPSITAGGLREFMDKCDFAARLCVQLEGFLPPETRTKLFGDQEQGWHDVFQQPIVYPPSKDHPLFQSAPVSQNPLIT